MEGCSENIKPKVSSKEAKVIASTIYYQIGGVS